MKIKSIKEIQGLKNKTVMVRCDFNVPIKDGKILSDFRLKAVLSDIKFLQNKGSKVVLIGHLSGKKDISLVLKYFQDYLNDVSFLGQIDNEAKERVNQLSFGQIGIFDNLRLHAGEEANDYQFAKSLASLADVYVNNAFSASHRKHASIISLPKYVNESCVGELFLLEVEKLSEVFNNDIARPFFFALGGAKFSTKLPLIEKYLTLADQVFVGGALAHNFFQKQGFQVGRSLVEDVDIDLDYILSFKNLILPTDVLVLNQDGQVKEKLVDQVLENDNIMDMGSKSLSEVLRLVKNSEFILWNGPFGNYEQGFSKTTKKVLELIKTENKKCILGGGDTAFLAANMDFDSNQCFISTGGGSMLEFLDKKTLPGIEALG